MEVTASTMTLGMSFVLDEAALGAQLAVEQAGDKLRLKLVSGEIASVAREAIFSTRPSLTRTTRPQRCNTISSTGLISMASFMTL